MSDETSGHDKEGAEVARGQQTPEPDPYPKMIIACVGIFLVLLMVIFGFIAFDFAMRQKDNVRPTPVTVTSPPADERSPAP